MLIIDKQAMKSFAANLCFVFASIMLMFMPWYVHPAVGDRVECLCSASECLERNEALCYTTVACYTQWLDRRDGSPPLIRGCIMPGHSSSLLCLNQRPLLNQSALWPSLVCCNSNRCNDGSQNTSILSTSIAIVIEKNDHSSTPSIDLQTMSTSVENIAISKFGEKLIEELREKLATKEAEEKERWSQSALEFRRLFVAALGISFTFAVSGFAVFCIFKQIMQRDMKLKFTSTTNPSSKICDEAANVESHQKFSSTKYSNISSIPLTIV